MFMTIRPIEEEFALIEKEIDGRRCMDFAENHGCLTDLYSCFDTFADSELVVYEGERLNYADIAAGAATLAAHLTADHGIKPGDRVALVLPNSPDWIIAFVAITAIGATPALINSRASEGELEHCITTTNCVFSFADRPLPVDLPGLGDRSSWPPPEAGSELPRTARAGTDEAMLMFTSGTTGKPKAATLTHRGLMSALKTIAYSSAIIANQMAEQYGIDYETLVSMRPPPVTLLMFPLFHLSGCHAVFLSGITQGGKLVLMRRWDAEKSLELMEEEKVTSFPGAPTMHWDILRLEKHQEYDLSSLTTMSVAGQSVAPALLQAINEAFPSAVLGTGYGMTEANGTVTLTIGKSFVSNPKSVGKLVATAEGEIRDEAGNPLPAGEVGEFHVRSASLMSGYANFDNANVFDSEGWYATGDIGYFDDDGNLYIVDRRTDMVISGGENIYCAEVEHTIQSHPDVDECATFGIPDERLGEQLVAVIRLLPGSKLSSEELLDYCGDHLTPFKLPRKVFFSDEPLPRNATGKVVKPKLKEVVIK